MKNKTAIIICSYNMVEYTDDLVEHIYETVKMPHDLIVVDNGSDLVEPSRYTTFKIPENIQMVRGFMAGVDHAKTLGDYDYYWLITTSCKFRTQDKRDPVRLMVDVFESDPFTFLVHPALNIDYGAWKQIMQSMTDAPRRVFGIEGVCPFYSAPKFDELGGWRRELTYGWGMGPELDFLARKNGWHIYIHDGYVMDKHTSIGYHMDRMNMTEKERHRRAARERDEVLIPIYGENYLDRFMNENISPEEMSMYEAYHGKK
jgi:hypothetical protein